MSISTPSGISYKTHGAFSSNKSTEIPHVHIICEGKCVSISLLETPTFIAGENFFEQNKNQEILNWVLSNLSALKKEWETKSAAVYNINK